ncbi:MAG TPA: hypothetical protein VHQ44_11525 [Thermoanaerobaculia bacterium]|jgi:hypothetical protein|nr:hypothetical protein [Thermoanaerobaculia bacterium]
MRSTSLVSVTGLFTASALFVLAGCASSRGSIESPVVAQAKNLPDHFMVAVTGIAQAEEPKAGEGCRNPMVDPRNGTPLNLMRSKNGVGDYQVLGKEYELDSSYGVDPRHLLRIDCATGKALGIVDQ